MAIREGHDLRSWIGAADRAQAEIFARLGRQALGGTAESTKHGVLFATRIPSRNLNGLFMTEVPEDPTEAVRSVMDFAARQSVPWSLVGRANILGVMGEATADAGLTEFDSDEGMILDSLEREEPLLPRGLVIEQALDLEGIQTCLLTMAQGYEVPAAVFTPLLKAETVDGYLADPPMAFFIGSVGGRPVAAAISIAWERVSYVFMVATVPEFRRRGIGTALTWRAALAGRVRGCEVSFLRASEAGRSVYKRMGFREVIRYPALSGPDPSRST